MIQDIKMKRKIIINLAISLDGFIADVDSGFDWIKGDGDSSHDTKKNLIYQNSRILLIP